MRGERIQGIDQTKTPRTFWSRAPCRCIGSSVVLLTSILPPLHAARAGGMALADGGPAQAQLLVPRRRPHLGDRIPQLGQVLPLLNVPLRAGREHPDQVLEAIAHGQAERGAHAVGRIQHVLVLLSALW